MASLFNSLLGGLKGVSGSFWGKMSVKTGCVVLVILAFRLSLPCHVLLGAECILLLILVVMPDFLRYFAAAMLYGRP